MTPEERRKYKLEWEKRRVLTDPVYRERRRRSDAEYRARNLDKCKATIKDWRQRNKEKIAEYGKKWRAEKAAMKELFCPFPMMWGIDLKKSVKANV